MSGAWAFLLAAAIGELIVLDDARGRSVPASYAVLGAYALVGGAPWGVAVIAGGGWAVGAAIRRWRGADVRWRSLLERVVAGGALGALAWVGGFAVPSWAIGTEDAGVSLVSVLAVVAGLLVGRAAWEEDGRSFTAGGVSSPSGRIARGAGVAVALGASAALVAVAHGLLGAGALLLLLPPVLAVRAGLRRYAEIRRTYDQTVVAMSRMTELTGHADPGHGVRVAELALALGREVGLRGRDLQSVERAGHLHELGRIVTDDPHRAGRDREVAVAGAAIVRQAGGMDGVADIIERHRDPYRGTGRAPDHSLSIASRIVHTACEYDRLVRGDHDHWAALDVLQDGSAHDPQVVSALVRIATR